MAHRVCVFRCPVCSSERVLSNVEQRCLVDFECKNCYSVSKANQYQECFGFRGVTAMNS